MKKYIYSYDEVYNILDSLTSTSNKLFRKAGKIGNSYFNYPINLYILGNGKKQVILMGATHGCELITTTFLIYFVSSILNNNSDDYMEYLNNYCFYIIPILNPEGYIISSSNVLANTANLNSDEFEKYCNKYLELYNKDDYNAENFDKKYEKLYKTLMKTDIKYIGNLRLENMVKSILKSCNLDEKVLPIWSSNGMGIDINANSIHQFNNMYNQRMKQKYAKMRYNDIPTDRPSPTGYPGKIQFDKRCPENLALYKFVIKLYSNNINRINKNRLVAFLSYHSTGSQIYGYPDKNLSGINQYNFISNAMKNYSKYTGYELMDEQHKYGVMDYYRIALRNVATLTIELSKLNANPIGPFANILNLEKEFNQNICSIFYTLKNL